MPLVAPARSTLVALLVMAAACRSEPDPSQNADGGEVAPPATEDAAPAPAAEVVAINGPGGLSSPSLDPGTFLGKGGQLAEGQSVETPRGTLAELKLRGGVLVRLNESTAVKVPSADGEPLVLTRGEAVIVAPPGETTEALQVAAGDEILVVSEGEASARNTGSTRHYGVVYGAAQLRTASKTLDLGPGESIDAPLPADVPEPRPELSLAPLRDTSWSRTFEAAARMADAVPAGIGSLTARRPGASSETQKRLRLTDQSVTVNIVGRVAHTEVEQAFFNDQGAVLEGIYRFPLPSDGSVSGLSLLVGNRWMDGEIVEKERARAIFKEIVDATIPRDPALLEWEQGNIFKLRVFPIPGRGERKIRLSYTQVLPVVGDALRYRFPLAGSGAGGTEIGKFAFTVNVDRSEMTDDAVADIGTPMLPLTTSVDGDIVTLSTKVDHFVPSYDVGIDIPIAESAQRSHVATHLDKDGQAYFMLTMRPDWEMAPPEGTTRYAFVVDRSHSVTPELWTLARGVVAAMAENMQASDEFTVLACDSACDTMPGGFRRPDAAAAADVQDFLGDQDLAGASDIGGMLTEAGLALDAEGGTGQQVIVYLGDGAPSSGELAADKLAKLVRDPLRSSRVMAVAMGARSDLTTLGAIVETTGGDIVRADARDDITQLVRELQLRGQVPVARELEVDVPDGMTAVRILDRAGLREGDSVVLTGKLRHPVDGDVVVRARGPRGPVEATFPVQMTADRGSPSNNRHLPRTWAAQQIAHLTKSEGFDARADIIELSKQYTVMSRFTSLLVLENDAMYREFNVVRAAKDTDQWDGNIETEASGEEEEPAADKTVTATPVAPVEEVPDVGARTGATRTEDEGGADRGDDEFKSFDNRKEIEEDEKTERRKGEAPPAEPRFAEPPPPPAGNFDPAPEPEPSRDAPADFEDDDDPSAGGDVTLSDEHFDAPTTTGKSGGASSGPSLPKAKPSAPPKKDAKRKSSSRRPTPGAGGVPGGVGGGVVGGWGGGRSSRRFVPPHLATRGVTAPEAKVIAQVDGLARAVSTDPTQRQPHSRLVRTAIRAGHGEAVEFARAWAEVDPDHAPALLSLADMLAAEGDPMALRAYESAVEVSPFDARRHESLATAFANKGDHARACSHHRALVSIDPSRAEHFADLARCLHRAGRTRDAGDVVADGRARAKSGTKVLAKVEAEIAAGTPAPIVTLPRGGQLKAKLTWAGPDDLDIVVVDSKGRRLSSMRPDRQLTVSEGTGREELSMRRVRKTVFVEVTRAGVAIDDPQRRTPVTAELSITTGGRTKSFPVEIGGGTVRVAKVFWTR